MSNFGDALGYMLVAGTLFLAPLWLAVYFVYEVLNALWHDVDFSTQQRSTA